MRARASRTRGSTNPAARRAHVLVVLLTPRRELGRAQVRDPEAQYPRPRAKGVLDREQSRLPPGGQRGGTGSDTLDIEHVRLVERGPHSPRTASRSVASDSVSSSPSGQTSISSLKVTTAGSWPSSQVPSTAWEPRMRSPGSATPWSRSTRAEARTACSSWILVTIRLPASAPPGARSHRARP